MTDVPSFLLEQGQSGICFGATEYPKATSMGNFHVQNEDTAKTNYDIICSKCSLFMKMYPITT